MGRKDERYEREEKYKKLYNVKWSLKVGTKNI
jgi:hypothetical protein